MTTLPLAPPDASAAIENLSVEERLAALESRMSAVESNNNRFMAALKHAGEFIFNSPASKMLLMSLPKDAKENLQKFFGGK